MLTLLKNANLYAPAPRGRSDLLLAGGKIEKIGPDLSELARLPGVETIDLNGADVVPGYIDLHEHITGGGGEQGPATRAPEATLTQLTTCGVTTVVGLLGTDGVTRSVENLLAKCRALNDEGITAYMLTGAYQCPSPTITGSVLRDVTLIDRVVGAKIALSDHRSSGITVDELIRLGADVRLGGMLGGKAGIVTIHMGGGARGLRPLFDALDRSEIPISTFLPTHMGRSDALTEDGVRLIRRGGTIDFTASEDPDGSAATRIAGLLRRGVDPTRMTLSSDGFGSMPRFDASGRCAGLTCASPQSLHQELERMVRAEKLPLETALLPLTANPARVLKLEGVKGAIAEGADADLVVYSPDLSIRHVFARGRWMVRDCEPLVKGYFET